MGLGILNPFKAAKKVHKTINKATGANKILKNIPGMDVATALLGNPVDAKAMHDLTKNKNKGRKARRAFNALPKHEQFLQKSREAMASLLSRTGVAGPSGMANTRAGFRNNARTQKSFVGDQRQIPRGADDRGGRNPFSGGPGLSRAGDPRGINPGGGPLPGGDPRSQALAQQLAQLKGGIGGLKGGSPQAPGPAKGGSPQSPGRFQPRGVTRR